MNFIDPDGRDIRHLLRTVYEQTNWGEITEWSVNSAGGLDLLSRGDIMSLGGDGFGNGFANITRGRSGTVFFGTGHYTEIHWGEKYNMFASTSNIMLSPPGLSSIIAGYYGTDKQFVQFVINQLAQADGWLPVDLGSQSILSELKVSTKAIQSKKTSIKFYFSDTLFYINHTHHIHHQDQIPINHQSNKIRFVRLLHNRDHQFQIQQHQALMNLQNKFFVPINL